MNIDHYKQQLLALERQLDERLHREVETARDERDDQPDSGDLARIEESRESSFTLAEADSATLTQVRDALARIDDGTYGRCVVDGEPIEAPRLEALPWTPYCLKHQSELEAREPVRTPSL